MFCISELPLFSVQYNKLIEQPLCDCSKSGLPKVISKFVYEQTKVISKFVYEQILVRTISTSVEKFRKYYN